MRSSLVPPLLIEDFSVLCWRRGDRNTGYTRRVGIGHPPHRHIANGSRKIIKELVVLTWER